MTDKARKELLDRAYELAVYVDKYPTKNELRRRVNWLTGYRVANLDALVEEVEGWLSKFREEKA